MEIEFGQFFGEDFGGNLTHNAVLSHQNLSSLYSRLGLGIIAIETSAYVQLTELATQNEDGFEPASGVAIDTIHAGLFLGGLYVATRALKKIRDVRRVRNTFIEELSTPTENSNPFVITKRPNEVQYSSVLTPDN